MDNRPWTYGGQPFSSQQLEHLKGSLKESFRHIAEKFPQNPAVTCIGAGLPKPVSYERLLSDVTLAQTRLEELAGDHRVIVVRETNSYENVVLLLAVLFSGRCLCPMNPKDPSTQIERQFAQLPKSSCEVSAAQIFSAGISESANSAPRFHRAIDEDAIYIFTSGSTGQAKVVRQSEAMILCNVEALIRHHRLGPGVTVATPLPLFHVNALEFSLLGSLMSGAHLFLFDAFNPRACLELIARQNINIFSLIPPMIRVLMDCAKSLDQKPDFSRLGYVVSAATALPKDLLHSFLEWSGVRIIQGYGLSEAVNFSCLTPVDLSEAEYRKIMFDRPHPTIGVEVWGNEVEVLPVDGTPSRALATGEICIRGWNVMPGYLGAEQNQPFADGFLRTGDLGYYVIENGKRFFFISGRIKDCIKRAGETIPLREIDDFIVSLQIPGLDAIAVPFDHSLMGEEVALVCMVEKSVPADWKTRLSQSLERELSVAFRPKVIAVTDSPIRTASGKPLRRNFTELFREFGDRIIPPRCQWLE